MPDALLVLSLVTALGAGLVAGAFFAFSTFVMAALGRVPAPEGIRAMQQINVTAINPWFMTAIFGTAVASLALVVLTLLDWDGSYGPYLVVGGATYVLGSVGVTIAFNVPRNDALADSDPESGAGAELWRRYLAEWTAWNSVRTVASLAAAAALIVAIAA